MFSRTLFWPWAAGLIVLVLGLIGARKDFAAARRLNKLVALAGVFFAAPLAEFGAEHLSGARFIAPIVPRWMPAPMFWTYLVGAALVAAAFSLALKKHVALTGTLLAIMFFSFVCMIHLPNVFVRPDRFFWALAFRDFSFGAGGLALAAAALGSGRMATVARLCIGATMVFYGVVHFLHPDFAPGVPLVKMTPMWVPVRVVWGYLTGSVLLAAGACALINRYAREAAAWAGLLMTALVVFLYLPILAMAAPSGLMEGINYVGDTLLFGGTILALAAALPLR